jgi:fructuronate reductase
MAEPFTSWVIEDRFAAPRPAWEEEGALIVGDVAPFETMKLRMLNGSHSTIAYLGFLMGREYVWQACADPLLAELVLRQMREEIAPTLAAPAGSDPMRYAEQLMQRFRNPALPHRTQQIAMDGSQKLPQRLLNTVRERIAGGGSYAHLALAVAGWIRYASGTDERGGRIDVSDPLSTTFASIAVGASGDPARLADGFTSLRAVFGHDLAANESFRAAVRANVANLLRDGARATIAAHLGRT